MQKIKYARLTEVWASISMGLILLSLVVGFIFFRQHMLLTGIVALYIFVLLESFLRGTYLATLATVGISLALIVSIIIILNLWLFLFAGLLVLCAVYLLIDNMRELRLR